MMGLIRDFFRPYHRFVKRWIRNPSLLRELVYCREFQFSQFGEDIFLNQYFSAQEKGFYVEIGGHHSMSLSNTYLFYRKGWRGLIVEPVPEFSKEIERARPGDIVLNIAISSSEGTVPFSSSGPTSGIADQTHLYARNVEESERILVQTRSLEAVFADVVDPATPIDFMSIDCEGHDLVVINSNDWKKYRPRLLLVEDHDSGDRTAVDDAVTGADYRLLCRLGLTKVFEDARK